ncbi:MAG: TIGR02466 family protein [Gemmatimonas sp.]
MADAQRQTHFLFPTVIGMVTLPDAPALNARVMRAIDDLRARVPGDTPDAWSGSLYTTFETLKTVHQEPGFGDLTGLVEGHVNDFARQLGMALGNTPVRTTSSWLNIYGAGHNQEIHVHANSLISAVYYVKAPPGVPGLKIHSPFHDTMLMPPVVETSPANMMFDELPAVEGRLIMFRSWTRHSVRANPVEGERVSIAFNLK